MKTALVVIDLDLPIEYKGWVDEMLKTATLFVTLFALQAFTTSEAAGARRSPLTIALFWMLGYTAYHLVVSKLIKFRFSVNSNVVCTQDENGIYTCRIRREQLNVLGSLKQHLRRWLD